MKSTLFQIGIQLVLIFSGNTQSLSNHEIWSLQSSLIKFLENRDTPPAIGKVRNSELIMIMLETDSNGKVSGISFLSDEKNKDSTYAILSKLTPIDFKNWQAKDCKSKVIIMPIFSNGVTPDKEDGVFVKGIYADKIFWDLLWSVQRPAKIMKENGRVILANPLNYPAPARNMIHSRPKTKYIPLSGN